MWTGKFLNPERQSCGLKNIRIRVAGAQVKRTFVSSSSFPPLFTPILTEKLPFVDICMKPQGNRIATSIHYKATESHSYLNVSSYPYSCMSSIPYIVSFTDCVKAAKYETQKPSTCRATLFRCKFLSMFHPCPIHPHRLESSKSTNDSTYRKSSRKRNRILWLPEV